MYFARLLEIHVAVFHLLSLKWCRMNVFQMKRQATGKKKGGKTSNKIKDINRTKYAQEISSEIKDVSVITMSKTCGAHQKRMCGVPGEFGRKEPSCGALSVPRREDRALALQRGKAKSPQLLHCCLLLGGPAWGGSRRSS